jgi:hypothetical protein
MAGAAALMMAIKAHAEHPEIQPLFSRICVYFVPTRHLQPL